MYIVFWTDEKSGAPEDRLVCMQVNMLTRDGGQTWILGDVRLPGQNTGAYFYKHGTSHCSCIFRRMPFHCLIGHFNFGDLIANEGMPSIAHAFFGIKIGSDVFFWEYISNEFSQR